MRLNIIKKTRQKDIKVKEKPEQQPKPQKEDPNVLNYINLKNLLGNGEDVKYRDIKLNDNSDMIIHLIYIDGMVNQTEISEFVVKPFMEEEKVKNANSMDEVIKFVEDGSLYYASQSMSEDIAEVSVAITSGASVILFDSQHKAAIFDTKGFEKRSMMEPTVENVNKGPRDSFIETYRSNTATIRRKIRAPDLTFENSAVGERTKTTVSIVYLKTITNPDLVQQVKDRINAIETDNALTTSIIEDALSDDMYSSLPQVVVTERPDKFSADLIEGKVGVLVDGLPFGFVVPGTFNQFMQTPEDYSRKYIISSFIRLIRYMSLALAIFLPSLYVAFTTHHFEMIPTKIILFIAKSREGVAFPVAVETLILVIAFEILFEASLRIPKSVGQTVSIVGTLIVGQAAVEAKLVSPSVIVIIAMTSIASFTIPNQDFNNTIRLWRLLSILLSIPLGLLGVVISLIMFVFELCKLTPFGVCYMSPFVGNSGQDIINDTFIRIPSKFNKERPIALKTKDPVRRGS